MGNDQQIVGDKRGLAEALRLLIGELEVVRLIDRDDQSPEEVVDTNQQGVRVLSRRNLESYLFDDEVLRALAESVGHGDKTEELIEKKEKIRAAITNGASNDLKPASGKICVATKKILNLTLHGKTKEAFMRDTLAPLIKPGMSVYDELKQDIFDS